ncbi:MFS transporter [Alloscardovia venturai]|uniref:MFS transporter n=2 Tax=Alloscardovia venturai TaxID=1769421 RepID=A0ABW2Y3E6_9BIFI
MTRATMSTIGLSMILCLNNLYNEWTSAGLMSAVYVLAAAFVTPVYARLFDKYGQRKVGLITAPIQFAALLTFAAAAYMRAPLPVLFALAVITGLCMYSVGAVVRTRWAWALRDKPDDYLNTAYALESAIDEIIFILGPIAAATISTAHPPVTTIIPFILFGGINFVGAMIFYNLKSATPPAVVTVHEITVDDTSLTSASTKRAQNRIKDRNILLYPGMLMLPLGILAFNSTFSAFDVIMTAILKGRGLAHITGFMLATIALGSLIGALIFGSRKHTHNSWMRMMGFMVALATGIVAIGLSVQWLPLAAFFGVFAGLFVSPTYATANLVMRQTAPQHKLTEGLSWISTGGTIGSSLGSAVAGIFLDHVGALTTLHFLWLSAAIAFPIFLVGYMQVRAANKKMQQGIK